MNRVATRRLIDASASLHAADRALLNLWVHRGLEDTAVARMTGMEPSAVAERRGRIVARLSEALGLPPGEVADALEAIAASEGRPPGSAETEPSVEPVAASLNGHTPTPDRASAVAETPAPATAGTPTAETPAPATADTTGAESPRSRRRLWARLSLPAVVAVVLLVVLLSAGGDTKHRRTVRAALTHTVPAVPVPVPVPAPKTSPSPSPTVSRPQSNPPAALPGGVSHARGWLLMSGRRNHRKLRLTVKGLPAAHGGHYEVWLYNKNNDSRPVARLRTGVRHLFIRLPRHSAHFRWIDISFQPVGVIRHSGESVLRAADPAALSQRQLRRRSAHRRQLRRAINGSKSAIKSK
jgi:hypothetical protein